VNTTSLPSPTRASAHHDGLRRTEIVILLAAPVILLLGRALLVPFDDQRWGDMLTTMADHPTRNAIGWVLALIAVALLAVGGLGLVRLVSDQPLLAVPATVGVALGWAGAAAVASGGLLMGDMAKNPQRASMIDVLEGFNEGNGNTVFFLVLAGVLGNVLLAVALARTGLASRGAAALLAIGAVGSLIAAPGPARPVAIVAALLLLAGHALVLRSLPERHSARREVLTNNVPAASTA